MAKYCINIGVCIVADVQQGAGVDELINEYVRQFSNNGMKTELKGVQGAEVCDLGCEYTKEE